MQHDQGTWQSQYLLWQLYHCGQLLFCSGHTLSPAMASAQVQHPAGSLCFHLQLCLSAFSSNLSAPCPLLCLTNQVFVGLIKAIEVPLLEAHCHASQPLPVGMWD